MFVRDLVTSPFFVALVFNKSAESIAYHSKIRLRLTFGIIFRVNPKPFVFVKQDSDFVKQDSDFVKQDSDFVKRVKPVLFSL